MIVYEKHKWWVLGFAFKGTVIKRMLVRLSILLAMTAMLAVLQDFKYKIPATNSTLHSLLGTALGLLLVFRTNASYDRYWEGRRLLGTILTNCRNIVRAAGCYSKAEERENLRHLVEYVSAFVTGLKFILRRDKDTTELAATLTHPEAVDKITKFHNTGVAALCMIGVWLDKQVREGVLERWQARSIEAYLGVITESQGGLERILNTPIPFAYAVHTHQFLGLYMITLPFTMVITYQYYALVAVFIIGFGLFGIDEAGVEIEDPFGEDDNDLPLELIFGNVMKDAKAIVELTRKGPHDSNGASHKGGPSDTLSSNSAGIVKDYKTFSTVTVQEEPDIELLDPE